MGKTFMETLEELVICSPALASGAAVFVAAKEVFRGAAQKYAQANLDVWDRELLADPAYGAGIAGALVGLGVLKLTLNYIEQRKHLSKSTEVKLNDTN